MKALITGIAGFYGHHLARYLQEKTDWEIIGIDKLDEGGSLDRLKEIKFKGKFFYHDLRSPISDFLAEKIGRVNVIFHLAALSHVDRSIVDPVGAVLDNVLGTTYILEFSRKYMPDKFIYFSTDEVFGEKTIRKFKEDDVLNPRSPYSAGKAGGEMVTMAYHNTYKVPTIISRCMNIFGERQHPEKFIPKAIGLISQNKAVPIYCDNSGKKSGSRSYIYADDVTRGLLIILNKGKIGEKYNIEGMKEITNLKIAQIIAKRLGKKLTINKIAQDNVRPGNDFKYGVDGSLLRSFGFTLKQSKISKINEMVDWCLKNRRWIKTK